MLRFTMTIFVAYSLANERVMSDQSAPEQSAIGLELLRGMAATTGVILTPERAATLAPQAEQHFAQLSHLDTVADSSTEPAAELRLDQWTRSDSG